MALSRRFMRGGQGTPAWAVAAYVAIAVAALPLFLVFLFMVTVVPNIGRRARRK